VKEATWKTRFRWDDIAKMNFYEIRWEVVDWFNIAQERDNLRDGLKKIMKFRGPYNKGNILTN
jgi:hypothetical protein